MKSLSMRSSRRRAQSGFTLVEIAIVLVIIGLLLGGVLKGQELIENGRVKNAASDMNGIQRGLQQLPGSLSQSCQGMMVRRNHHRPWRQLDGYGGRQ